MPEINTMSYLTEEKMKKDLNYYLNLPYTEMVQKIKDESGEYYYAQVLELDGCQSDGKTVPEALNNVHEAMEGYIAAKLEYGDHIPEPKSPNEYSGRLNLRLPKSLHQRLAAEAEREGVSLNQYMVMKLSR
ncbi:toxin-antitoxin system HicB family antitoxin [Sporolactobacillus vineae]|uniref:toxin-antitoxin system HicB family antitoxin n=1 Tax=Sporolactobacillus vineae TaxID=444463 RepID=UPI000287AE2C|nr:toxin-antitoxin system HicB family antitoxin [Sporolactobacillus vineae]